MYRIIFTCFILVFLDLRAQYSKGDSLRGTLNEDRNWWDVDRYDLKVRLDIEAKTIKGSNGIKFRVLRPASVMQIDLQDPLQIDSVFFHGKKCKWTHLYNAWKIELAEPVTPQQDSILIYYSGKPRAAKFAPWDGGIIWGKDEKKRPWISVACQGLGASVWWPNKDHQSDEPDKGMSISITVPDTFVNISNGNLVKAFLNTDHSRTWVYSVKNPINNYDVTFNVGKFIVETEYYEGLNGKLRIEYCVLDYNRDKIQSHLKNDTRAMLKCFEYWFGAYPFYEDGYRLVETSYLGMEHQSAVAYGNKFKNGYLGKDRSRSGLGLLFDFIIVHESGHEWFGNNITTKDIADMWIHEGFTTYSEALFIECKFNRDSCDKYVQGLKKNILNDRPLIEDYGVNREGSSDIYDKGACMIHMIRKIIGNDSVFREILLGLNREFGKRTVETKQVEDFINLKSGKDFTPVFDQYLRTQKVPQLEYKFKKKQFYYRYVNCNEKFNMPLKVFLDGKERWIYPENVQKTETLDFKPKRLDIDRNFYVGSLELK